MAEKGFGIKQLDIMGSAGIPLVESKAGLNIRVGGTGPSGIGHTVGIGTTGLATWLTTKNNADPDNVTTLNCGIVTANYLYGTFKGIIDPTSPTISLNSNIQDVLNVAANQISADDAGADKIVFWDDDPGKLTHLTVGTGLQISGTTLSNNRTYTLEGVDSGDNAILRLSDGTTDDDVTITAGSNITIDPVAAGGFTISATSGTATVATSDTAPGSPSDGDLWWNSITGILNVYYEDANSSQWVNATGRGGASPTGSDVPVGGIIMYSGTDTELNALTNWKLCDGNNGTPNLKDKFIIGADQYSSGWKTNVTGSLTASGGSKDAVVVSHSHTWQRQDAENDAGYRPWPASNNDVKSTDVQTSTEGVSGTDKNLPPYYTLAYIMRVS